MQNIETVTIFRTWIEIADALKTDAERGKLYHAICRYSLHGETPELEGVLASFYALMKPSIDKSNRRKIAQQTGVMKRVQKDSQSNLQNDLQNSLQNSAQDNLQNSLQNDLQNSAQDNLQNDSIRARKTGTGTGTGTGKKRGSREPPKEDTASFAELIPHSIKTEAFTKVWLEWEKARRANHKKLSTRAALSQLKLLSNYQENEAIEMVQASIHSDWQGIFPLKNQPKRTQTKKDYSKI